MKCSFCGAEMMDDTMFCSNCGAKKPDAATQQPTYEAPVTAAPMGGVLSEKEFYARFMSKNSKSWVTALMVIAFLTAGLSLILMLVGNIFALVDVVFYLVMGILLLKKKKWGIALATTIYGGVGVLLTLFTGGGVTGIVALICGIMATKELKKFAALYAAYQQTGVLPAEPVVTSKRSMKNH